ncbi:zinc-binding dehydrogenase [Archangium lipolyticum]|uniref:zinc-binding dehydrogenase n=1 Tax=Archangium lipolyticum TaxID=2970465 RepID=UPI002149BD84|nr:zinc-binding dehydrogenase [Archangium lipolyticum]
MSAPHFCTAAVMHGADRPVELQRFSAPELEPGGVLLETIFSEVCGTDVHLSHSRLAGVPYPIIPGHVSVGKVLDVRGEPRDVDGRPVRIGSTVTFLDVVETCNACWFCLVAKMPNRCPSRRVYGVTYSAKEGLYGGWSQLIYLKPGVSILEVPPTLKAERVIAGGCALPTAIHAVDTARIKLGDRVLVQGAGPVGLSAAVLSLLSGAGAVYIVDRHEVRLTMAREFGVDEAISLDATGSNSHVDRVLALTDGRGVDVTIEATGAPAAVKDGIHMTRDGGRYVIVGHYTDHGEVGINPHTEINRKHIEIRGVWGVDFSHFYRMLRILDRHGAKVAGGKGWEHMVSRIYGLDEVNQALADVESGRIVKGLIRPNSP